MTTTNPTLSQQAIHNRYAALADLTKAGAAIWTPDELEEQQEALKKWSELQTYLDAVENPQHFCNPQRDSAGVEFATISGFNGAYFEGDTFLTEPALVALFTAAGGRLLTSHEVQLLEEGAESHGRCVFRSEDECYDC